MVLRLAIQADAWSYQIGPAAGQKITRHAELPVLETDAFGLGAHPFHDLPAQSRIDQPVGHGQAVGKNVAIIVHLAIQADPAHQPAVFLAEENAGKGLAEARRLFAIIGGAFRLPIRFEHFRQVQKGAIGQHIGPGIFMTEIHQFIPDVGPFRIAQRSRVAAADALDQAVSVPVSAQEIIRHPMKRFDAPAQPFLILGNFPVSPRGAKQDGARVDIEIVHFPEGVDMALRADLMVQMIVERMAQESTQVDARNRLPIEEHRLGVIDKRMEAGSERTLLPRTKVRSGVFQAPHGCQ